ncbi:MAG: hypothetical protein OEY52_16200 [Gammaproteobacteria bacterium]|nr:hypothetical protein [Gammaproteobacteria bacterium]
MRQKRPEFVPGDKQVRQNWLIFIAFYILFLIWLEPLVDFLLSFDPTAVDPFAMSGMNEKKMRYASIAYAATRSLPVGLMFWLGYRVVTSARIPPARMKLPFTVQKVKGRQARVFGLLLMGVSLFLLYWEMVQLSRTILI